METVTERVLAPAKVNLFLRIVGRRADGYHVVDSVMVPIGLHDEIEVRLVLAGWATSCAARITVHSDSEDAPGGPDNLAYRAAAALLADFPRAIAVDIGIRKRIPVGSGMGGGSSDAAGVLLALNRLLGCPYNRQQLAELGATLGADVPFFVYGRPARVGGVGEQITPLQLPESLPLVVCWDGSCLSTPHVYSLVDLSLTTGTAATNIEPLVSGRGPISGLLMSDLEAAAVKIRPEVQSLKTRLVELGALGALMTGSGSAVFGVWSDRGLAEEAARKLRDQGLWAEAVITLDESPAAGS
jgi:4-diphosphocytidyl-2-C-methyl-D-erythritol kinase